MINCIIIEDEVPAQEILKAYIDKIPDMQIKGIFNSPIKATPVLKQESIDVLFLDINLPNISGINFLKTLSKPPKVIMTTAYSNYAAESYELESIIDYLVKPFSFERFLKAINRLLLPQDTSADKPVLEQAEITTNVDSVFINVDKTLHKVDLQNIMYVQSDRNYVTVFTKNSKFSFIDSLKNWNSYLEQDCFVQIHKSFIININFIDKLTGNIAYINQNRIPIGRFYKDDLLTKVKLVN